MSMLPVSCSSADNALSPLLSPPFSNLISSLSFQPTFPNVPSGVTPQAQGVLSQVWASPLALLPSSPCCHRAQVEWGESSEEGRGSFHETFRDYSLKLVFRSKVVLSPTKYMQPHVSSLHNSELLQTSLHLVVSQGQSSNESRERTAVK